MNLADLVTTLNIKTRPGEHWLVISPEANIFGAKLSPARVSQLNSSAYPYPPELQFDGLLLAGALAMQSDALAWLKSLASSIKAGAPLIVIDWQADGPLHYGPDLERRLKRGALGRFLRENDFGFIEVMDNQAFYYVVRAIKGRQPPVPHAGEFVEVADLQELSKNRMKMVEIFGQKIIVANTGKEIVAFAQTCPHANGSLDQGKLRGRNVICPLHGYIWNVCTGQPVEPADEDLLARYPVKVDPERGRVLVALSL